ncbi:MAG: GIY-YIG nuclease family protein [Archangium sp.]|nr:GIY-YIG nuclease family protein [Archangium sp.]
MPSWHVYMVRCVDDSLYTGCTNDLARRVAAHNAGKGARYTRSRRPVKVVWSVRVKDKSAALSREAKLKQLSRAEKLLLVQRARALRARRAAAGR